VPPPTILVTGATDGLGRAVAGELAARDATVLVHGRNSERGEAVVARLREESGNRRVHLHVADLASLAEVRRLADEVVAAHERLDVLVNNAGIGSSGPRAQSADGYELRFAVNYLSQFLLTRLLLDRLRGSAPSRVVNVASIGQHPIDFDDVMLERSYDGSRAYAQSKLAQIMFTFSLAERVPPGETTVNALHPASLMDTKMVREAYGRALTTVEQGRDATLRLILDPALQGVTGRYFDGMDESSADPQAYDEDARRRLWELSERLTGGR
jgi:NAD(P)-dependent dehydrogenase (short-subunit alcohol dehydrogenase family)